MALKKTSYIDATTGRPRPFAAATRLSNASIASPRERSSSAVDRKPKVMNSRFFFTSSWCGMIVDLLWSATTMSPLFIFLSVVVVHAPMGEGNRKVRWYPRFRGISSDEVALGSYSTTLS